MLRVPAAFGRSAVSPELPAFSCSAVPLPLTTARLRTPALPSCFASSSSTPRPSSRELGCKPSAPSSSCSLRSRWMTFFGAAILMTVSLIEITFYIAGLNPGPAALPGALPFISLKLISAVQHLYFFIAAPALFCPLGLILVRSCVLPRVFGYLALVLAVAFASLGVIYLRHLTLPDWVTSFAAIQALWWLAASIALIAGRSSVPDPRK